MKILIPYKGAVWRVAFVLMMTSNSASAELVLQHNAHGASVSINVADCVLSETRDYADGAAAIAANLIDKHVVDLEDVSLWIHRRENGLSEAYKVGDNCEAWRYADQCITLDEALNVSPEQDIRLACDEMYVSCMQAHHLQGNFELQASLQIFWWKDDSAFDNVDTQLQLLSNLHAAIEACKTKHDIQEAVFREDDEGALLRAQDKVREYLQDLDAEFREVSIYGPIFAAAVCGEVKPAGEDAFLRFVVSGPVGTKVDGAGETRVFDEDYWGRYCK